MARIVSVVVNVTLVGIVHLLCCFLPVLALFLNNFSIGWLVEFRTPLLIIQIVTLAWSFWHVYRHDHNKAEKTFLWVIATITLLLNVIPHRYLLQTEESQLAVAQVERLRTTRVAEFALQKPMESATKINDALRSVAGVVPSQVQFSSKKLTVRYRLGQTSEQTILTALRQNGVQAELRLD
jgi:hypothetical protein